MKNLRPTSDEIKFLNLAYNKFYDIYEEIEVDNFWLRDSYYRFTKINTAFSIYTEILNYDPIKWFIKHIEETRPPMESVIASELFKFIRNIFAHFPFFDDWDEVYINKEIINWYRKGLTIDKFLKKYTEEKEVKYRFWEIEKKQMTYLTITFPVGYEKGENIYLKDILPEKIGVKFSLHMMKNVLDSQVVKNS